MEASQTHEVSYADNETRLSYEVAAAISYLEATLPPEEIELRESFPLIPITFHPSSDEKGTIALFFANDFLHVSLDDETIHYIRPRTKRILDILGVQYDEVAHSAP